MPSSSSDIDTSMSDNNNKEDIEIIFGPDLNSDLPHEILGVPRYDPSAQGKKKPKPQRSTSFVVNTGCADNNSEGGERAGPGGEHEHEQEGYECYDVDASSTSSEDNDYEALVERAYRDLARKYHPKNSTTSKKKTAVVASTSTATASNSGTPTNANSQPTDKRKKKKVAVTSTSLWAGGDHDHFNENYGNDGEDDYENNQLNTTMVSTSDGSAATAIVVNHEDINNDPSTTNENNISIETIDSRERQIAFLKITRAYAALKGCIVSPNESYDSLGDGDGEGYHGRDGGGDVINTSRSMETTMMSIMSHEEAQNVYESKYGPYRDMYYSEAGMIGIPYAADLKEMWAQGGENITATPYSSLSALPSESSSSKPLRDRLSIAIFSSGSKKQQDQNGVDGEYTVVRRLNFFRVLLLKKDMNLCLCISEILLTWTVIAFCAMAVLVNTNPEIWPAGAKNDGQIINIVGGVSLMIAQFIVAFWYGFTQYPAGGKKFLDWLFGKTTKKRTVEEQDIEEIRDVCSQTLHNDKEQRFSPWILALCFPVVIVDQTVAWIASLVTRLFLAIFRVRDNGVISYSLAVSKTVSALAIVVGYYCCWMYGNVYCKVVGTAAFLMSQKMHTAMLFKMGLFEFVQTILFGNFVLLTNSKSKDNKQRQLAKMKDIEANMGGDDGLSAEEKEETEADSQAPSSQTPPPVNSALRPNPKYSTPKVSPQVNNSRASNESNPKSSGDDASYDGSLEMSYIEKNGTVKIKESLDGTALDRTRSDTGESVGTSAREILEDLNVSSPGADDGSADIVAMHKAAKRRLEETFSSTRPRVSFADHTEEMSKNRSFDISLSSAYSAGTDNLKGELIRPLESSRSIENDENDEDPDESVDQDSFMLMKTIEIFQVDDPSAYNSRSFDSLSTFEERNVEDRTTASQQVSSVQNFWNRSSTWTCGATAGPSVAFAGGSSQSFNKLFQRTGTSQSCVSRQRTSDTLSRASATSAVAATASSRTPTVTMRAAPASNDDNEKDEFVVENIRIVSLLSHGADDNVGDYDGEEEVDEPEA